MNVGSLFSGIGGLDLGLARAGFRHAFFCESDAWRRTVLAHHWPGVPIYEDVCAVREPAGRTPADGCGAPVDLGRWEAGTGLLCGGFPCQDVSVAGRRAGLAGERSGLFHEFARIAESLRPRWLLVENVPGLLSSNGGRDFGVVLGTLADIGYGVGWRIVDSRFFGVPQRRRRVFIVGALADGDARAAAERAGEILAVGTRCPGHPATGAEARENAAQSSASGTLGGRNRGDDIDRVGAFVVDDVAFALRKDPGGTGQGHNTTYVANTLKSQDGRGWSHDAEATYVAAPLSHGSNPNSNMAGRRREDDENLVVGALREHVRPGSNTDHTIIQPLTSFDAEQSYQEPDELAYLTRKLRRSIAGAGQAVRRLTPTECERLQALPDGWTDFGPDSRRYAALGDAVTASVSEWIGRRLILAA